MLRVRGLRVEGLKGFRVSVFQGFKGFRISVCKSKTSFQGFSLLKVGCRLGSRSVSPS